MVGEAVRLDVAPDGLCVVLVLPPEIAAQWPVFHQRPHVTLVHDPLLAPIVARFLDRP